MKCVLFDRDGTLGDLTDNRFPQTFVPFFDIRSLFDEIHAKGYVVGILTNQSSIARGTGKDYDFDKEFLSYGADIWEICPHDDKDHCNCRKPKPGLLVRACESLKISPSDCIVVGDRISDVQCALHLGATPILVLTGRGRDEENQAKELSPTLTVLPSVKEVINVL